ncbi:GGDEF domain-containing protein [Butyrivibrio sp. MC2013]|uniref:GGDEF domain-containing protein n=1 Tax=Butyrivibrio sp. MC2013 TaxID=1280686 RepID=UPI000411A466|nr:GGDEF domain-containing protein [Butyrivibrio sp. MC2013]
MVSEERSGFLHNLLFAMLAALIPVFIFVSAGSFLNSTPVYPISPINYGWMIKTDEGTQVGVSLASAKVGLMGKGQSVTMTNSLPVYEIPNGVLYFRSDLATVTVSIDGNEVYRYGFDYMEKGKMVPVHYNFINVLPKDLGKQFTITLTGAEVLAFSGLPSVVYGNADDLDTHFVHSLRFQVLTGVFLWIFGLIELVLYIFFNSGHNFNASMIFSGMISFLFGLLILCYNGFFYYISSNEYLFTLIEYIALYLIPPAMMGFLIYSSPSSSNSITRTFLIGNIIAVLIMPFVHFFLGIHINTFLPFVNSISVVEDILIIAIIIGMYRPLYDKSQKGKALPTFSQTILMLGQLSLLIGVGLDLFNFVYVKYLSVKSATNIQLNLTCIGALIFVICIIVNFFLYITEHINEKTVRANLEGIAYTDALTGISNRARCEQAFKEITEGKDNFIIISFDLDRLKAVNDTFGHNAGDKMIADFARILADIFEDAYLAGRMGGDEFIVIIIGNDHQKVAGLLRELTARLGIYNETNTQVPLHCSWGVAAGIGGKDTAHFVYMEADAEMYIRKMLNHAALDAASKGGTGNE